MFDAGDILLLDERASLFHWATFFPKELGAATAYHDVYAKNRLEGDYGILNIVKSW